MHPLEVGNDDAAGVRKDVGQDEHALVLEEIVGRRGHRPVCALDDDLRLHLRRVLFSDHLLECARRKHVAFKQEQFLVRDRVGSAEARERPRLALVRERGLHVDPVWIVESGRRVGYGDHLRAVFGEELRQKRADVSEALHGGARSLQRHLLLANRFAHAVERAARGGLLAPE